MLSQSWARRRGFVVFLAWLVIGAGLARPGRATDAEPQQASSEASGNAPSGSSASNEENSESASRSGPDHAEVLKDATEHKGLLPLYRKDGKLWVELSSSHYGKEYLILISIARGIGQGRLLGGMSWGFGDDWVWRFRKVDDRVHVIRRNVRFKAKDGSPEATAVEYAFTDSVLFSLPIITRGPNGGDLVELTSVFMSDLPQISQSLPGFTFSAPKSTWKSIKAFDKNVELQVAATYQSSGQRQFETVADSRGVTIVVHYSISEIPTTGYQPRLADPRVGYFLTVLKDFSERDADQQFRRYINRWHLEKANPEREKSAPKEPIVFWIENTVPFEYRKPIRDGILEWNKAFEEAGFLDAIEVRQQPDDADWDPEDVNYNTFRWITSDAGFAMGPSRVNPYTGQILDADIIFDSSFLAFWQQRFETMTPEDVAAMTGETLPIPGGDLGTGPGGQMFGLHSPSHSHHHECRLCDGMAREMAFGAAAIGSFARDPEERAELKERMIMQGLKDIAMHEVGHTLGLRHNFKGSRLHSLEALNRGEYEGPMVASVMDYNPALIVPQGYEQGDFFSTTIGPYDYWAIEYGYRQFSGNEAEELKKIASRSGERELQYATDEDTTASDPDPHSNRFDLGDDSLAFAKQRAELMGQLIPNLVDRMVEEGEDYTKARRAFNVILSQYGQAMVIASRYVGGIYTSRSHRGDEPGRPPMTVAEVERQRESLGMLADHVFCDQPFQFPPEVLNKLGPSRWRHWGTSLPQQDFPIHQSILMWQERVLSQLLNPTTLHRITNNELRVPAEEDALTAAELIQQLTATIFAEVHGLEPGEYTTRQPAISSVRRNLQRAYLRQISQIALGQTSAPQDCQTVAWAELDQLGNVLDDVLDGDVPLDAYSEAHLRETQRRIEMVLEAGLSLASP